MESARKRFLSLHAKAKQSNIKMPETMNEVLACFHNIVTNVSNSARLQEESDALGLCIAQVVSKKQVNLGEYGSYMLAPFRSLLPKDWDSKMLKTHHKMRC